MASKAFLITLLLSCLLISVCTQGLRWKKTSVDSMEQQINEEKAADELRRFKDYFKRKYNQGGYCSRAFMDCLHT